jgi:hypothetical protein
MPQAAEQEAPNPKVVRMPNLASVQSVGVGGIQFNVQTILQSPFFWMTLGAAGAWFVIYSVNQQKK